MAERTLTYVVEVDGKQTTKELKSIEDYQNRIKDLGDDIAKQPIGSKKYKELQGELKRTEKGYAMATKSNEGFLTSMSKSPGIFGTIGQTLLGVTDQFDNFRAQYIKLDGGLKSIGNTLTGNLFKGTKTAATGFKILRGALISTGIGALVVAFGALVAYFTNTEKGSKMLKTAFNALGIVVGRLTDLAASLGEWLVMAFTSPQEAFDKFNENVIQPVSEFFSDLGGVLVNRVLNSFNNLKIGINAVRAAFNDLVGDEEEANELRQRNAELEAENQRRNQEDLETTQKYVTKVKDAYNGLKKEIEDVIAVGDALETSRRGIRDLEQEILVQNSQLRGELEKNRKIYDNTNKSYEERKEALDKMNAANEAIIANEIKLAKEKERYLQLQIQEEGNYEKNEELQTQLAQLQSELNNKQREYNNIKEEGVKLDQDLQKQEDDRLRAIDAKISEVTNNRVRKVKEQMEFELAEMEKAALQELELLKATEEEKQKVRDEFARLRVEAEQEVQKQINDILFEIEGTEEEKALRQLQRQRDLTIKELEDREATEEEIAKVREYYAYQQELLEEQQARERAERNSAAIMALSDSFGQLASTLDETSAAYQVLIKIQQAAALASTAVALANAFEGLGKDLAKGFPTNLVAVASTLSLMATAFAQFKALTGMGVKKETGGKASGGRGTYRARGGMVYGDGTGESDSVTTHLSRGESVINARSTKMFKPILSAINEAGGGKNFNSGGVVGGAEDRLATLMGGMTGPVKAYVVSSDVTSMAQLDRQTKSRVKL